MYFEIINEIKKVETIAVGGNIRLIQLPREAQEALQVAS
jgi:hypothetical protein